MPFVKKALSDYSALPFRKKVICVLLFLTILLYLIVESSKGRDFICYLDAANKLLLGLNIYQPPFESSRYLYHPLWATLLIPFLWLPSYLLIFMWNLLNLLLFIRSVKLLQDHFGLKLKSQTQNFWMWFIVIICIARFLQHNFLYGQMTVFIFWSMIESIYLTQIRKYLPAGIILGFSIVIKLIPLVLLPYLLYRNKINTFMVSLVAITLFFFLPLVVTGFEQFRFIIHEWILILQPDSAELASDNSSFFPQNLSSFLFRWLTDTNAPYTIDIFHLTYSQASVVVNIILLLLISLTFYFLSSSPFKNSVSKKHTVYELSYIMMICPLIFPHQQKYAFLFTLPAVACLVWTLFTQSQQPSRERRYYFTLMSLICSFVLGTLTSDLFIGMHYSEITQHLKTITIGTFLLIPALAFNKKYFLVS